VSLSESLFQNCASYDGFLFENFIETDKNDISASGRSTPKLLLKALLLILSAAALLLL
jgi:hypothetical protein